jgi:hypothetical protein
VAPPNYEIESAGLIGGKVVNKATLSVTLPNAGWPAGEYRADLLIDGKPAGSTHFTVTP